MIGPATEPQCATDKFAESSVPMLNLGRGALIKPPAQNQIKPRS
jgi:hypothetical protein